MKFDALVSHDFMIVASVLLLSALFNKTLVNVLGNYEAFATATKETPKEQMTETAKSFISGQSWVDFLTSKYFWFPSVYSILTIVWFFTWLFIYVLKRKPSATVVY